MSHAGGAGEVFTGFRPMRGFCILPKSLAISFLFARPGRPPPPFPAECLTKIRRNKFCDKTGFGFCENLYPVYALLDFAEVLEYAVVWKGD